MASPASAASPVRPSPFRASGEQRVTTSATVRRTAVGVLPAGHPADVRQPGQAGQRAAAEVEAVDLRLGRRVGERERR